MKRICLPIILAVLCLCGPSSAQLGEIGINPFMVQMGARPLGMGGAFVGLADDVNALLYNPGGMAWAKGISLTLKDLDNITALQAYPTGYGSSLGLAVAASKISDISISSGTAYSSSSLILLSYGTKLFFLPELYKNEVFQQIGVGFNLKGLLGQTLARTGQTDRSGTGWNMDLGALWRATDWWSAGVSLQNVLPPKFLNGGEIRWDAGTEEAVHMTEKIGASARIIGDVNCPVYMDGRELVLGGEVNFSGYGPMLLRLGGEWGIEKTYFLRSGIMQQYKGGGAVSTGLNFGLGWRSENWGADAVIYREPIKEETTIYISALYFPREWIVIKRLEFDKPSVTLEKPFERISLYDNYITYDSTLEVAGKVKSGVDVLVNGLPAAVAEDNTFKVVIPLQPEKNLVVVEARFEREKKLWKYKVLRKTKVVVAEEKELEKELGKVTDAAKKEALKKKAQEIENRREKVEVLTMLGVIEVTPEAEFKLEASIKRGELAAWLVKAAGIDLPRLERDPFPDVKRDNPLAPCIKAAADWDLLRPFPDGTFRPDAPVSKEEGEKLFKIFSVKK